MARQFSVSVPHRLEQAEARARIRGLLQDLRKQYGAQISHVEETWRGNRCDFSLRIKVVRLSGTIEVGPDRAEIRGSLPLGAGRFEDRAKELIAQRARELLA